MSFSDNHIFRPAISVEEGLQVIQDIHDPKNVFACCIWCAYVISIVYTVHTDNADCLFTGDLCCCLVEHLHILHIYSYQLTVTIYNTRINT